MGPTINFFFKGKGQLHVHLLVQIREYRTNTKVTSKTQTYALTHQYKPPELLKDAPLTVSDLAEVIPNKLDMNKNNFCSFT